MTRPGYVQPQPPGWWVRTNRVGLAASQYRWDVAAVGRQEPLGEAVGHYGWAGTPVWVEPPLYDATGAGYTGTGSPSYTHTLGASALAAVIGIILFTDHANPTMAASVGGVPATKLGERLAYYNSGGSYGHSYLFGLLNPLTGPRTITASAVGGSFHAWAVSSVSYTRVSAFGTATTGSGSGTAPALSVPSAAGRMVAQLFGAGDAQTIGSYNKTSRKNFPGVGGVNAPMVQGDAAGAATVNFDAVLPISTAWGAVAVPLVGILH